MGLTIKCKKTGRSIDMSYSGFFRLRNKVAELAGSPFAEHYATLAAGSRLCGKDRTEFFERFDKRTLEYIRTKSVSAKVVDFLLQSDCDGKIHYGACKVLLRYIGDYDDDVLYGYAGRPDCAKFADFKAILQDCVQNECDMVWYALDSVDCLQCVCFVSV